MEVSIEDASRELSKQVGRPEWLHGIGIGSTWGVPAIHVYLRCEPKPSPPWFNDGWMGYPVVVKMFGQYSVFCKSNS